MRVIILWVKGMLDRVPPQSLGSLFEALPTHSGRLSGTMQSPGTDLLFPIKFFDVAEVDIGTFSAASWKGGHFVLYADTMEP